MLNAEPLLNGIATAPRERRQEGVRIDRLSGTAEIREQIEDLAFATHRDVLAALRLDRLTPARFELHEYLTLRWIRRGVAIRYLLDSAALDDASIRAYVRQISAAGAEIRTAPGLQSNLLICDNRSALLYTNPEDPDDGAMVTTEADLVAVVRGLFSQAWKQATTLGQLAEVRLCLEPTDQQLINLILKPGKDLARARELGVSLRTFHRRVADLYERLGVTSRTEAALVAREYMRA
ncbi:hypothetical protein [Streptomyces sp. Ac-502]|uniref:hypothetical protein n=1 Tax=Streptomyces sp. Ac-502 TaxID=3342801 RepID=UPI00386230E7